MPSDRMTDQDIEELRFHTMKVAMTATQRSPVEQADDRRLLVFLRMTDQEMLANVRMMWAAAQHSDPARLNWAEFCGHIWLGLRSDDLCERGDAKRWQDAIDQRRDEDN
tara:strand:- start:407 stop:733 length:327 start_codon:yes stop_codon:yes gene_type:complete